MTGESRSAICERARFWASLLPDGELSVFERRLLEAHCNRCSECRHLLEDVGSLTAVVRSTPLDEMTRPVRIPSARFRSHRQLTGALASGGAAALALVLAVWVAPQARNVVAPQARNVVAPQSRTGRITTQVAIAPVIIVTPEQSSAESQAIWNLKRERGVTRDPGTDHRTGLVLP